MTAERKTDQELVDALETAAIDWGGDKRGWDSVVQPQRDALLTRLSELRAENERLRKIADALEWAKDPGHESLPGACYACGMYNPDDARIVEINPIAHGHRKHCPFAALTTPTEDRNEDRNG